jgi:hypothetical protein
MHRWKINARELHMFEELLEGTIRKWPKIITTRKNIFFLEKRARTLFIRACERCSFRTHKHCSYVHEALFLRTRKHCSYVRVNTVHTYAWTLFIHWNVSRADWSKWTRAGSLTARESRSPLSIYLYLYLCILLSLGLGNATRLQLALRLYDEEIIIKVAASGLVLVLCPASRHNNLICYHFSSCTRLSCISQSANKFMSGQINSCIAQRPDP